MRRLGRNDKQAKEQRKRAAPRNVFGKRPLLPATVVAPTHDPSNEAIRSATFCIRVVNPLSERPTGATDRGIIAACAFPSRRLVVGSGSDSQLSAWEKCGSTQMSDALSSTLVKSAVCVRDARCWQPRGSPKRERAGSNRAWSITQARAPLNPILSHRSLGSRLR